MTVLALLRELPRKKYDYVYTVLTAAFNLPKPLFETGSVLEARELFLKQSKLFETAFVELHNSLNSDKRQEAQILRSGLQYLVDDLRMHDADRAILDSDAVLCVEEFITNARDSIPEYYTPSTLDLTQVPSSHTWWP